MHQKIYIIILKNIKEIFKKNERLLQKLVKNYWKKNKLLKKKYWKKSRNSWKKSKNYWKKKLLKKIEKLLIN